MPQVRRENGLVMMYIS